MSTDLLARLFAMAMAIMFACNGFVIRGPLGAADCFFASLLTATALLGKKHDDDDDDDGEAEETDEDECEVPT